MSSATHHSPWICHICDATSTTESQSCALCFKIACSAHLRKISLYNRETGIYEIRPVCLTCALDRNLG